MKFRLSILLLAFALCLPARAQYVTASVTFTNPPATGDVFHRNGASAQWTNGPASTTIWIQTNGPTGSATNLWRFLGANNPALYTRMTSPTNVTISGAGLSVTSSPYAVVVLTTNVQTNNTVVTVPLSNQSATNATNIASQLLTGIDTYASNAFRMSANAMSNFVSRTNAQTVTHKVLDIAHVTGSAVSNSFLTNITRANIGAGRITNALIHGGTATNLVTYSLSAPGTGTESMQLGSGAYAAGDYSFVAGVNATNGSGGDYSVLLGNESKAEGLLNVVLGYGSWSSNDYAVIIGPSLLVTNDFMVLIAPPSGGAMNSASFGPMADNQVWIGTASESVWIPGATHFQKSLFFTNAWATNIVAGIGGGNARITNASISASGITATNLISHASSQTNAIVHNASFPGTNRFSGAVYHTVTNATGMANGDVLLDLGITRVNHVLSGNTATINICGIKNGADGRTLSLIKTNIYNIVIRNLSGSAGTAASERIYTGTGGDRTYTNSHLKLNFTYDATLAAWILEDPL